MIVHESNNIPDSTYFRTGDCEPAINEDGSITIYDGDGSRRSWGAPGVTSTVILDECDLLVIHVGFHHKHGGGQFWRYYTTDGDETRQITWGSLPDETRQQVLNAKEQRAPAWAKAPGKLRANYRKPTLRKRTTYKMVEKDGDDLRGLYDGTEYEIGKRLVEKPRTHTFRDWDGSLMAEYHGGGYYSHPSPEQVKKLWDSNNLVPAQPYQEPKTLALIECEIAGTIIRYPNGKLCSTYLTPVKIVETIEYAPEAV